MVSDLARAIQGSSMSSGPHHQERNKYQALGFRVLVSDHPKRAIHGTFLPVLWQAYGAQRSSQQHSQGG